MNAHRWREIAFIPQSAMNSLDPVYRVGRQMSEVLIERGGMDRRTARRALGRAVLDGRHRGRAPRRLSRTSSPAACASGSAIALALALKPEAGDRRRAGDRARRGGPAPGAGRAARAPGRAEPFGDPGDPRHQRRRLPVRRGGGDVRGQGGRIGQLRRCPGAARPSLHHGPVQRVSRTSRAARASSCRSRARRRSCSTRPRAAASRRAARSRSSAARSRRRLPRTRPGHRAACWRSGEAAALRIRASRTDTWEQIGARVA